MIMSSVDNETKKTHSLSKVLPSVGNFSLLRMSNKVAERSNSLTGTKNTPQSNFIQEYSLCSEFNLLKHHAEPGVYVIPAATSPFIWFGVIFIRNGIYEGGIFRFRLFIPQTFPNCTVPPKVVFETPVFHPLIDPSTYELYLKNTSLFSEWKRDLNHLWQVISYLKSIFYEISTNNAINKQAANLYERDKEGFLKLVQECVDASKMRIYEKPLEDDPHYLVFDEYNPKIHDPFRESILKEKSNSSETNESRSISWIQPGSLEPLSKQDSS